MNSVSATFRRVFLCEGLREKRRLVYLTLLSVSCFIFVAYNSYPNDHVVVFDAPKNSCPKGPILTVKEGGNTANNVWEYLSVLAVSKLYPEKDFAPYIPDAVIKKVEEVFERVTLPALSKLPKKCRLKKYPLVVLVDDPPSVIANSKNDLKGVLLDIWSARYDEVVEYGLDKVKKELRFRQHDVEKANRMLNSIKARFRFKNEEEPVFVSVHYRGGDYNPLLKKSYKKMNGIPTFRYYNKAMDFFKKKYANVIFVVISTDHKWLSANLRRLSGNVVVNPNKEDATKVDDFVLLSHCNHSIINYGTFGVTAAIMAGGTTILYDLGVPLDHKGMTVGMGMAELVPGWMKMDEKK